MKFLLAIAAALSLSACASTQDYTAYADAIKAKAEAESTANAIIAIARYQALAKIAASGDTTAKVSAAMAIQSDQNGLAKPVTSGSGDIAKPESASETALRWASILVPSGVQATGMYLNAKLGTTQSNNSTSVLLRQSDNATAVQIHTNDTMKGIANMIVPVPAP